MLKLKDTVKVTRPFAVFFTPVVTDGGHSPADQWEATIIGQGFDNTTCGEEGKGPQDAFKMAFDLFHVLTGVCCSTRGIVSEHRWVSFDNKPILNDDLTHWCANCGERCRADQLEEVP